MLIYNMNDLSKYSNFSAIKAKGKRLGFDVLRSTRKDKKYMIIHDGKKIHFGQMGYEDFSKHKDDKRRSNFLKRNANWKNAGKYTPAYLSYHILW